MVVTRQSGLTVRGDGPAAARSGSGATYKVAKKRLTLRPRGHASSAARSPVQGADRHTYSRIRLRRRRRSSRPSPGQREADHRRRWVGRGERWTSQASRLSPPCRRSMLCAARSSVIQAPATKIARRLWRRPVGSLVCSAHTDQEGRRRPEAAETGMGQRSSGNQENTNG